MNTYINKKIIVFDLDDTLTQSKTIVDEEMINLLNMLLEIKKVAIISGQDLKGITWQVSNNLSKEFISNLYILPANGSSMFLFNQTISEWTPVYEQKLSTEEINAISNAYKIATEDEMLKREETYGPTMENRGGQITFSGLGQNAPLDKKKMWDPNQKKRLAIVDKMQPFLPEFNIKIGGTTSLDITPKGIDKAYGAQKLIKELELKKNNLLYIGDAIYPGGNDYSIKESGYECIKVENPEDTKKILVSLLKE